MAKKLTPREIEELYEAGEYRLTQERNDFLLPQVIDFVNEKSWINLKPEYQRRLVWDRKKRSRFIESLLMNIPVPPIFLYEYELNRYEVMDGQQRLNSIVDFYSNNYKLTGLDRWASLNGMSYSQCPEKIQRGLDRRRISAVVLLAENAKNDQQRALIRRDVFERLNTGGQNLNAQEMRNALYPSDFNQMLIRLAGNSLFDDIWGIPRYEDHMSAQRHPSDQLAANSLFKRMGDCELVLRFFAFRKRSKIVGSVRKILDTCMKENLVTSTSDIAHLEQRFVANLQTAQQIFGRNTFKAYRKKKWTLSQPLYDAVMVALDELPERHGEFIDAKTAISRNLKDSLENEATYEIIVGKPNTAKAVKERIDVIKRILLESTDD